jgi:hypothetical protein
MFHVKQLARSIRMAHPLNNGHNLGAGPVEGRYRAQRVGDVVRIELEAPDHPATDAQGPSPTAATAWWDQSKGNRWS